MSTSSEAAKARRHGTRGVEAMLTSTEGVEGGLPLLLPMVRGILTALREERRRTEANVYLSPSFIMRLSFSLHRGCACGHCGHCSTWREERSELQE